MPGLTPTAVSTAAGSGHNASHQPAVGISVPSKNAGGRGICAVGWQVLESIMGVQYLRRGGKADQMPQYTSIVTMLVVLFYFFIATRVPLARRKFNVLLPAINGHPDFERV